MNQMPANARFLFMASASGTPDAEANTTAWIADDAGRHALLLRFIALNMGATALLAAAWGQGWLQLVIDAYSTGLTFVIVAVFAVGFIFSTQRVFWLDREFGLLDDRGTAPPSSHVHPWQGPVVG